MPNAAQTRLMSLDFIDENPATKAFRTGQTFDLNQRKGDLEVEQQMRQNDFARQADPIRLRNLQATTSKNETEAKYADESERTKLDGERAKLDHQSAKTKLFVLDAINTAYDNGDFKGGDEIAQRVGTPISKEWKESAEARYIIKGYREESKRGYSSPKKQWEFVQKGLEHVRQKKLRGEPFDPSDFVNVPGAPERDSVVKSGSGGYELFVQPGTDEQGKPIVRAKRFDKGRGVLEDAPGGDDQPLQKPSSGGGGGTANRPTALKSNIQSLIDYGIARNEKEAFDLLQLSKRSPETARNRIYAEGLRSNFGDVKKAEEAVAAWERLNSGFLSQDKPVAPPSAPPQATPTPPRPGPRSDAQPPGVEYDRPEIVEAREALARALPQNRAARRKIIEKRLTDQKIPFHPSDLDLD